MPAAAPRCAVIARADGYLPAGTAASARTFLLVEVPLPWPSEVTEHPLLQPLAAVAAAHEARVQAVVPDPAIVATPEATTRVVVYRRPDGPFVRYDRDETLVPTANLAPEVEALLSAPHRPVGPGAGVAEIAEPAEVEAEVGVVDVLVCTHGRRDVCCGGDGFRVFQELTALALPGVRVWRTSHTGGHRFAPTAVTFPDGRAWASVDARTLAGVLARSLDPGEAVTHDRGCAAFADPFAQAAEGAVLAEEGWRWLDLGRTVESAVLADDRRAVTVTGQAILNGDGTGRAGVQPAADPPLRTGPGDLPAGDRRSDERMVYRAEVVVRRVVPVPDCGRPLDEARKSCPELEVVSLTRV